MDFAQLACFVRAYECGNFSQAAADLYLAQTSLTYRIASLEKELGCELFVRTKRGVVPTDAARAAYDEAVLLIQGEARLRGAACTAAEKRRALVRVGFNRYPGIPSFFEAVDRYRTAHPDVAVETDFTYLENPSAALEAGTHDVVLLLDYEGRSYAPQTFEPLGELRYHVTMASGHPLGAHQELELKDLRGQTVYVLKPLVNSAFQVPSVDELRRYGAVVDDSLTDNELLLLAIRQGSGVSVYPSLGTAVQEGYARRPLADCSPLPYGLLFSEDRLTPAAREFIGCVKAAMADSR